MIEQVQQHAGAVGAGVTAGTGVLGFFAKAVIVLQVVSFGVSIVVGVLTAIWYIRKLRRGE